MDIPHNCLRIVLKDLSISYERGRILAVDGVSLNVFEGETICVLGPSGCGKSTLLHGIAGFIPVTSGVCRVVVDRPRGALGFLFQEVNLFPWLTAKGNVAFSLIASGRSPDVIDATSKEMLREVGLEERGGVYPFQLSGGMQQRVALARCLAANPEIVLADEPFGALDSLTRAGIHRLFISSRDRRKMSVVFVTHDVEEAILLSDRIVILSRAPAKVVAILNNPLPQPREVDAVLSIDFAEFRRHVVMQLQSAL